MFGSLVHSIIHQLYICLIPVFPFSFSIFNWCIYSFFVCTLIDAFTNWIIVSVFEYLWLFVFGYYKFNVQYNLSVLIECLRCCCCYCCCHHHRWCSPVCAVFIEFLLSLSRHPNACQRPNTNTLPSLHHHHPCWCQFLLRFIIPSFILNVINHYLTEISKQLVLSSLLLS